MYVAIKWCKQKIRNAAENFLCPELPRASSSISLDLQKYTTYSAKTDENKLNGLYKHAKLKV